MTVNQYGEDINYDVLESHEYSEGTFYTCPICGNEYLADFITEDAPGEYMCIECWNERH